VSVDPRCTAAQVVPEASACPRECGRDARLAFQDDDVAVAQVVGGSHAGQTAPSSNVMPAHSAASPRPVRELKQALY